MAVLLQLLLWGTNMSFMYSSKTNMFYFSDDPNVPEGSIEVDDETFTKYVQIPPENKQRGPDENGLPSWVDAPKPTKEEYVLQAEYKKAEEMAKVALIIAPLQDAVDMDMATDEETALLTAWKKYRVLLNRVDTSTAPDIVWPTAPQ